MPVISPRRYSTTTGSTSYLPPTSSGTYRSSYSSSTTNDRGTTNYTTDFSSSYGSRSNYFTTTNRSSLGNSTSSASTTTSKYGGLTSKYLRTSADKELPPSGSASRYTRGDSRTRDRGDLTSSGNTPSSSLRLATTAADLYEKYSPSSYIPKCELSRSRSLSEAQKLTKEKTPTKDNYNSNTSGSTSSLSKVKLCALTASSPLTTHLNSNSNININNHNNNNNNNILLQYHNKPSVTNHNSAFGLTNKQHTDACIAITNAATSFIIDSSKNKFTSDVVINAMNPSNNNQIIHNNNLSSARTKNFYNMKASTTSTDFSSNSFGGLKDDIGMTNTYKTSYSNNGMTPTTTTTSSKDMLKNEIDLVRSQLKSKSSEINNNSHNKLLSSSTKSISNNVNNNNLNNNNNNSHNGHNPNQSNGLNKITLPVKPLIHHTKNSLIKQNSLSNEILAKSNSSSSSRNSISSTASELEVITNKVLNSRTKFVPKPITTITQQPTAASTTSALSTTTLLLTTTTTNGGDTTLLNDDIKFIDNDENQMTGGGTGSNDRVNRDGLTSIGTVRLLPSTPANKIFSIIRNQNDHSAAAAAAVTAYEADKLSLSSTSSSSSSSSSQQSNGDVVAIKNSDDAEQKFDSGIDSNGSSTWDSTSSGSCNTIASVVNVASTPPLVVNGNGGAMVASSTTMTTTLTTVPSIPTSVATRGVSNGTTNSANDDKLSNKLIETDFDNTDSYRNASSRVALPPSSSTASKYWDRERPSPASRTLSDSDSFALSKSAFTSSSSLADSYDRGTSTETAEGLCGLRNIGNTCFMNSVLQCLSHTSELTKFLKNQYAPKTTTKDQRIFAEFVKLIKDMWSGSKSVTPLELKSAISSKYRMYSGSAQQDAQEFLRFFLDTLHCALNSGTKGEKLEIDDNLSDTKKADLTWEWYSRVENSLIKELFVGQLKSSLKCTVCGNTSVTFDPFWDLSVPLPSSTTRCKLENCLDIFIKEEVLDGDEMPTCSKCKTRRKSTKTFTIQRFPKYLVIHLKRFSETRWSKLTTVIEFPTVERGLDMSPYAASSNSSSTYTLYGISNHMGSTAGGHYVAMCKHPLIKKWYEFNDNVVSESSDYNLVSSSAYLLFYERS